MNVYKAVREYVGRVANVTSGMKVMLLDNETTSIVSMVYTQSQILEQEVYLVDKLSSPNRETMVHLKALVLVRPIPENISLLISELQAPKYGSYYLFFTNVLSASDLEGLANADVHEVVKEVQEVFADYYPINSDLMSLNLPHIMAPDMRQWESRPYKRTLQGVLALLLSLKKKPCIRFQGNSAMCKRLASDVEAGMRQEASLFDFRQPDVSPLLLILDRREDPVTPLLNQWTYQAMLHERLTVHNQRIDLSGVPGIKGDLKEVVLPFEFDEFYQENKYKNFGDIGMAIKSLVDSFQETKKTTAQINTIADMRTFLDNYPQFRLLSGTVHKHATLVGELYRLNNAHDLLDASEAEQAIACQGDKNLVLEMVAALFDNQHMTDLDCCRLLCLCALRYEGTPVQRDLQAKLRARGYPEHYLKAPDALLQYAGSRVRGSDLFGTQSILSFTKKALKGLKGVDNVYTQHEPLLAETLSQLLKGKLREDSFPFLSAPIRERPQDIVVFMVGGTTYEEARTVARLNETTAATRIVLGSTHVHNCKSFLDEVMAAYDNEGR